MIDGYGRNIDYLRISITDRCNLRCIYCMPNGIECASDDELMTYEEVIRAAKAAGSLGISKIKITGGEPLVRKDCIPIIAALKKLPGIEQVTITTNGVLLKDYIKELIEAGIDGINVSLDTMNHEKYQKITGKDYYQDVYEAIKLSADSGIKTKINVVSLDFDKTAIEEIDNNKLPKDTKELIEFAREYPVDVRFIEIMPVGFGKNFPAIPHDKLKKALMYEYPMMQKDNVLHGNGPAEYYRMNGYKGSIGLISAIHGKFCDRCNRIRLTSKGELKSCLCYEGSINLLSILRDNSDEESQNNKLISAIKKAVINKPNQHCFEKPEDITEIHNMVSIGG